MSHRAVNWALEQRQLKPGAWVVLIHLADRHNKDTRQVNPRQDTLSRDCNMSRATVNRHLDTLESAGILTRVQRQDPATKRQLATFYILGLDFDDPPDVDDAVSQNETREHREQDANIAPRRVSKCDTEPCLNSEATRVSILSNPVSQNETLRTLVIEPGKEPCADGACEGLKTGFEDRLDRFVNRYPRAGQRKVVAKALRDALSTGVDPETLIAAAGRYAAEQRGNAQRYIARPENWLKRRGWEDCPPPEVYTSPPRDDVLRAQAALVTTGKEYLCGHISASLAREMLARGLVTEAQCRAAGVQT